MKIVISAAGKGTRMLHLTKNKPKHLIKIKGKPFLYYLLKNIKKAGFFDIILVVGYKAEKFKEFLESGWYRDLFGKVTVIEQKNNYQVYKFSKPGYSVILVNQYEILGTKKYGTACPLMCVKEALGKENFVSVCGDNLYSPLDLKAIKINDSFNYVASFVRNRPEKYGVLVTENSYLKKIVEKPKKFIGNLTNTGLYKFTPEIHKILGKIRKSPRGEYELTDALSLLAKRKKIKVLSIKDYFFDFGNPADIIRLSKFLSKHKI